MESYKQCVLELALRFFKNRERLTTHCSSPGAFRLDDVQASVGMAVLGLR